MENDASAPLFKMRSAFDYDRRFKAEDEGAVPADRRFRWAMVEGKSKGAL